MHNESTNKQEVVINSGKRLLGAFEGYVANCAEHGDFPNLAGFRRRLGLGEEGFSRLQKRYPEAYDLILTALEDEALNADKSASLITAYLKHRLAWGEVSGSGEPELILVDPALTADGA